MVTVSNAEIADKFDELADLLDIEGANPFRVRAYRSAARTIRRHPRRFMDLVAEQADLAELPDIGESLAQKIVTIVETGKLPALDEARRRTPTVLSTLMKMRGIGPKRVRRLHDELKIRSMADVERAAKQGRIRALDGFGEKTEALILAQLADASATGQRRGRLEARETAEPLKQYLERIDGVKRVAVAGSYRRCRETVGDLDILVTASRGADVIGRFIAYDYVAEVVSHGSTRSTVTLRSGMQVDVRVVPDVSYGAALLYFTGSKDHNIALRKIGQRKRLKVNEYGVFRGDERIAGRTENEVYAALGLPFIPPELRENRGEVEAAAKGRLPGLVERSDIRGDLHCHTRASDGHDGIRDMAEAAKAMGYEYLAITDHSRRVRVAHGLNAERLAAQIDEIDRINDELDGIVVLKSCEVDILDDGSLDVGDDLLRRLDLTVCAVHYAFNLSRNRQTRRILKAMDSEYFDILAHPTGRLINERPPYDVDLERIMGAASRRGCFLELNAYPGRLDLTDEACRMARELGVTVSIGTDAHSADTLDFMGFGVDQARRGWLGPGDVLNTRSLTELRSLLGR
jgi:DNA polymerase (family 10)